MTRVNACLYLRQVEPRCGSLGLDVLENFVDCLRQRVYGINMGYKICENVLVVNIYKYTCFLTAK